MCDAFVTSFDVMCNIAMPFVLSIGLCPSPSELNCLNALFLYPCETDGDCSRRTGMVCCPTNCPNYAKSMCVSRGNERYIHDILLITLK